MVRKIKERCVKKGHFGPISQNTTAEIWIGVKEGLKVDLWFRSRNLRTEVVYIYC